MSEQDRFDKFTERAKRVLSPAQEEAQRFLHNYIAAGVLERRGAALQKVRTEITKLLDS